MTQTHTPPPWFANAIAKGRIIGGPDAIGAEKIQIVNRNATVATVYRPKDAHLIAAAPEVAAAAAALLRRIDNLTTEAFGRGAERAERETLRKALQKAGLA